MLFKTLIVLFIFTENKNKIVMHSTIVLQPHRYIKYYIKTRWFICVHLMIYDFVIVV